MRKNELKRGGRRKAGLHHTLRGNVKEERPKEIEEDGRERRKRNRLEGT